MTDYAQIAERARELAVLADNAAQTAAAQAGSLVAAAPPELLLTGLTVFALACLVGYYVIWRVTPALHSPLMAVTNAISSVIIVGAIMAAGSAESTVAKTMGFVAVTLASINIFGGFLVTERMLGMYRKQG